MRHPPPGSFSSHSTLACVRMVATALRAIGREVLYSVFLAFTLQPQTQLPQSLQGCCSTPCGLFPLMVKFTAMVSASTEVPISCARRFSACTLPSCMARGCTEGASTSRVFL